MENVIISACLVGDKVRYDGRGKYNPLVKEILEKYNLIPVCPEVLGGLSIPRDKAEIIDGSVITEKGKDVTNNYFKGAKLAFEPCKYLHINKAILQEKSPSCGVHKIYDGKFKKNQIDGEGKFTTYLRANSVDCYTIEEFYEKFIKNEN